MPLRRDELGDLMAFLAVAEERSFTRAAARLGTSQSSLSHVVRRLEERLDVRLLTRTTRNVAPTEAGTELADTLRPAFTAIEDQLTSLDEMRAEPAGTIRLTSIHAAARDLLMPVAQNMMAQFPNVRIEIRTEQQFTDIVKEGYDAGVRLGEAVEKDMIAVRIGPDMRMLVVGSPDYFAENPMPRTPHDLRDHSCINLRLPTLGGLYPWELGQDGNWLSIRVEGQFTSNDPDLLLAAALAGQGLAFLPEGYVLPHVAEGRLVLALEDWCPPFPGFHLYYPSRRQMTPAFRALVDRLRYRP